MITSLYSYFGIVGILSIVAWAAAMILIIKHAVGKKRTLFYARALLIALIAWLFAEINSRNVSLIQADRSQELKEAMERQMQARADEERSLRERAADIRFVEDDEHDRYDLAGVPGDEKKSIYELAAEGKDVEPLYRKAGKQVRAIEGEEASSEPAEAEDLFKSPRGVKVLPEKDRTYATSLARLNLRLSRLMLLIVLIALLYDYFARFNTINCVLPFPVSCRALDHLFPKKRSLLLRGDSLARADYLETALRKGESFLFFGQQGLSESLNLARIHIPYRDLWRSLLIAVYAPEIAVLASSVKSMPWRSWLNRFRLLILQLPGALTVRSRLLLAGARIEAFFKALWQRALKFGSNAEGLAAGCRDLVAGSSAFKTIASGATRVRQLALTQLAHGGTAVKRGYRKLRSTEIWNALAASTVGADARESVRRLLARIELKDGSVNLWPAKLLPVSTADEALSDNFIFESAWFNRYSFSVADVSKAASIAGSLKLFLEDRHRPRAVAWRTVHIVWDMDSCPLPREQLEDLLYFANEANYKLVLFDGSPAEPDLNALMEEAV